MKKLFFAILLATTINFIQAQNTGLKFFKNVKEADSVFKNSQSNDPNQQPPATDEGYLRAVKNFSRSCKDAAEVKWYPFDKGSYVKYTINGKDGRRVYNKKGNFLYEILTYSEQGLPHDIRARVKQVYYMDYNIDRVHEIFTGGKTIYIVQVSDKTGWKKLRICGQEDMEIIEEFSWKQ